MLEIAAAYAEINAVVKSVGECCVRGKGFQGMRFAVISEVVAYSDRQLEHAIMVHQYAGPKFRSDCIVVLVIVAYVKVRGKNVDPAEYRKRIFGEVIGNHLAFFEGEVLTVA